MPKMTRREFIKLMGGIICGMVAFEKSRHK